MKRISMDTIINLVTEHNFSREQNRHILAKSVAQAQLDEDEKELRVIFEKIESSELAPDTDDDQTVRIIILSYGKFQALKKRVLK